MNPNVQVTKRTISIGKEHVTPNFTSRRLATKSTTKHYCAFGKQIYLIGLPRLATNTVIPTVVSIEEELISQLCAPVEYLHFVHHGCPLVSQSIH